MTFSSLEYLRRAVLALSLAAAVPLLACCMSSTPPCDLPAPQTEHFVITEARAAVLVAAAADGGAGRPTCRDECTATPHMSTANSVSNCSVDGPTDGGVGLTCVYGWL